MRKILLLLGLAAALLLAVPASAITDGELDGDGHPAVVLVLMEVNGAPAFRCTGTLIAPRYVVTAGHCAGEPGEFSGMRVFTESDIQNGRGVTNNYPFAGPNSIEATRWASHPQYTNAAFFLHDVGMIELSAPFVLDDEEYGDLPAAGQLNSLATGRKTRFTSVGYGLQRSFPSTPWPTRPPNTLEERKLIRMVAEPHLLQVNVPGFVGSFALMLSNNASTGGTCFGDSGGPNYLGSSNTIAAVTSFGLNSTCGGTGGVFRLDQPDVLSFIDGFMAP